MPVYGISMVSKYARFERTISFLHNAKSFLIKFENFFKDFQNVKNVTNVVALSKPGQVLLLTSMVYKIMQPGQQNFNI